MKINFNQTTPNLYASLSILFVFLGFNFSAAGQKHIQFTEKINWTINKTSDAVLLKINNQGQYSDQNHSILAFKKTIKIQGTYGTSVARLREIKSSDLAKNTLSYDEKNLLTDAFQVHTKIRSIKGATTLEVTVIPFKNQGGTIKKLDEFELEITNTPKPNNTTANYHNKTAANSVLENGTWYKFAIATDGVYKININHLSELGIDVSTLNPSSINIYGNGGELLPFDNATVANNEERYDDLQKNSIYIAGEDDGSFDQGDYILFYGKGPNKWKYNGEKFIHTKHYYSDSAYYFLRIDDDTPKRIANFSSVNTPPTQVINTFQDYQYWENNNINLIHSGRNFFGEEFDQTLDRDFSFNFPNLTSNPITVDYNLVSRSLGQISSFDISSGTNSETIYINTISTGATANVANLKNGTFITTSSTDGVTINLKYNKANPAATGWLDYLRVNATRTLAMVGTQMHFRSTTNIGPGNVSEYHLSQANSIRSIWDITNLANVKALNPEEIENEEIVFTISDENLHQFIAFTNSNFLTPTMIGSVENQNLHALTDTDLIIVSSPLLLAQAEEIAELHRAEDITVAVVTPLQVFNEFSSGTPDVTAIKLFMRHLYNNATNENTRTKNLFILGDASFSGNKSLAATNTYNVICYESLNSVSPTYSYVTDDYFVLLDDIAEDHPSDTLRMGVGRIPASNETEAQKFVDKLRIYMGQNTTEDGGAACLGDDSSSSFGPWRNLVVFVSDDRDGNGSTDEKIHMITSDNHANDIYANYNDFNVVKLYMDAYHQVSTPGGERYPEGASAIRNRVEDGALLVTYIGHGGVRGWAHERILNTTTIQNWTNKNKLPVFFTATCELARFDFPEEKSAGELLILNPNGGAIAMLTTTRVVYTAQNASLGNSFFEIVLDHENRPGLTLGDIMKYTKNNSQSVNTKNFSLLGDPALKMNYPKKQVFTTEINGNEINPLLPDSLIPLVPDTIKALQEVTIKGYVGNQNGNILTDFNGFVYPSVYDKKSHIVCQNNDNREGEYSYDVFKSILYKGKATVTNGLFEFTFVVPKDINFTPGTARVSYYAVDNSLDANGNFEKFVVGGISENVVQNTEGPKIELFLNDTTFVYGGITNETPILVAKISDSNGINTTGNGIGHNIKATIDNQQSSSIVLNENYEADLDTYKSGKVRYQLDKMEEGQHNISLKVWDVQNNSSEGFTEFIVARSAEIALEHVLNYPNPFTTHTDFYFEHNQACEFLEVQIQVFTVGGKLVKTINQTIDSPGFKSEPISWDGKDDFGDRIGRGVYVYRVKINTPEGKSAEKFEKLVILK